MQTDMRLPWVVVVPRPEYRSSPLAETRFTGDGHEILLQGFHWDSHAGALDGSRSWKSWYTVLRENAEEIKAAGFSWVWFPPPCDSLAPQGYIPRRWNVLDTAFGTEAELRAAIRALEPVGALGDLVLNHRVGVATSGADFESPAFPDNRAAVTRNDDSGVGTGDLDTGETYAAGRDLDHTNPGVRATIVQYLRRLKEVGFRGWRYDFVKGYHGRFVAAYNEASMPEFSVGEFYDTDRQRVTDWVDATAGKSTAFDFPTRYLLYQACMRDDYSRLRSWNNGRTVPGGLLGYWPGRAVTFIDNHDTEYRRDAEHRHQHNDTQHFPGEAVERAHAYILTHPGIPCVFWSHYFDWGLGTRQKIHALIRIRKEAGIQARSAIEIKEAGKGLYAAIIDGRVAVKLGSRPWSPGPDWFCAIAGEQYAVWQRR
jgi:alpha-amylase